MKELAEHFLESHSYNFNDFNHAIEEYRFTWHGQDKIIVFCRMTFIVIKHNLSKAEWREFCICLKDMIMDRFGK